MTTTTRVPAWVWALVIVLASIEPLTHLWIAHFLPEDAVHSGLHIGDSVIFLHAMAMFDTDFYSPFVSCQAEGGRNSPAYFPMPFLWMYGAIGFLARTLGLDAFMALGIANGMGALVYLLAVFLFLQRIAPRQAKLAFVLFAIPGGLGGITYLLTAILGLQGSPVFEERFMPLALYELLEGSRMSPVLVMPRLYYTVPMALGYLALAFLAKERKENERRPISVPAVLLLVATFLHPRLGPLIFLIAALYLFFATSDSVKNRWKSIATLAASVAAALAVGWFLLQRNPAYGETAFGLIHVGIWVPPLLSLLFFHLFLAPREMARSVPYLPTPARAFVWGAAAYLGSFVLLHVGYHLYYGEYGFNRDYNVAVRMSDPALLPAALAFCTAWVFGKGAPRPRNRGEAPPRAWLTLWFLLFLVIGISGWGQGLFLRLVPLRMIQFLGPPICLLSAAAIQHYCVSRPKLGRSVIAVMVACGLCTTAVAALRFQGPLGLTPGKGPYYWAHAEAITAADAACLEDLGQGVVLSPATMPPFGDIVTLRNNPVVSAGYGTLDLSDRPGWEVSGAVLTFFDPASDAEARQKVAEDWCVDWVYCPNAPPVPKDVVDELRALPWLHLVAEEEQAVLFKVIRELSDEL